MKTILIVDDEKAARAEIKSIIRESGVPVEMIMECPNGETALEVLSEQEVDVLFTDVCMPVMDGIELVRAMKALKPKKRPLAVAVSAHDDFSYAVEMMRNGVQEYLLKPPDRERIKKLLLDMERQVESETAAADNERSAGHRQLKYYLTNVGDDSASLSLPESGVARRLFGGRYAVCIRRAEGEVTPSEDYIFLADVDGSDVFLASEESLPLLLENELAFDYVGISGIYSGEEALRKAYVEARRNRYIAYMTGEAAVRGDEGASRVPEGLSADAAKLLEKDMQLSRIQLVGTEKTSELCAEWERLFRAAERLLISPEAFLTVVRETVSEMERIYRGSIVYTEDIERLRQPFSYGCLQVFQTEWMDFILSTHESVCDSYRHSGDRKMSEAVAYIEENYAKELNMAVVSNHISMNYSLFSYQFKQYTGSNFVNYLKNIRMEEAKRLLRESDYKVNEISRRVGYDNEKHFMKTFKMSFGVSPGEYRKNMKGV